MLNRTLVKSKFFRSIIYLLSLIFTTLVLDIYILCIYCKLYLYIYNIIVILY